MKSIAVIPIKQYSKRVESKNFRSFCGEPLYSYVLKRLVNMPFDEIYLDTDSEVIADFARSMGWGVIERPPHLAADGANGNDLLIYEATQVHADIYFQLFITAPLLQPQTIRQAHAIMTTQMAYDSLFTAVKIFSWFWYNGRPVNYDPKMLPRSQDATPIIRETTGLYAIRRETLLQEKCRIGVSPYILFVQELEAIDIDTELDFFVAESLCSGLRLGLIQMD